MWVKPVVRGMNRPFLDHLEVSVEFSHTPGCSSGVLAHLRDQKAARFERQEVVRDAGPRSASGG